MGTNLKNVLRFEELEVGVPTPLPHLLNVNGRGVVPRIGGANAGGIDFTANTTNVIATRTADGPDTVDVYVEYWHTIEALVPQNTALGALTPLFFAAGGGGGGGDPIVEHFIGNGSVDPPQAINPLDDAVFLQNTEAESTLQFTLANGTVDGHIMSFKTTGSTNTRACTVTVASFDPEEAGNEITVGTAPGGSFQLIWNGDEGYWQVLGTPRGATIA